MTTKRKTTVKKAKTPKTTEVATPEDKVELPKKREAKRPVRRTLRRLGPKYAKPKKGFRQRWVHDRPGKIQSYIDELGYDYVRDENDSVQCKKVKLGSETIDAFLMCTPDELYQQGVDEKEVENKERDLTVSDGQKLDGFFGHADIKSVIGEK